MSCYSGAQEKPSIAKNSCLLSPFPVIL